MKTQNSSTEPGTNGHGAAPSAAPAVPAEIALSAVSTEFHNFFSDIEDLFKAATSLTGEDLARAKASFNARVAKARASLDTMGVAISDRAKTTARLADGYVHDRPWQAIGIGAALGVLVGLIVTRRRA